MAAGILLSRLAGLAREIGLRRWLGVTTRGADAFAVALVIPKLMQNLLGEGSLSASFIPVYSRLLEDGDDEEAGTVAGAVFTALAVLTALLVLIGLLAADPLASLVAPGFSGDRRALTVDLLRVTIGGVGLIVLAAWCLGVLNAHRRFFLSYVAPVVWNVAIIAAVAFAGLRNWAIDDVARAAAWGVLVGGGAQFLVQLPAVLRIVPRLRLGFAHRSPSVRTVARRFGPAVAGRGVVTLSTYLDVMLASLLATGAPAALGASQVLYLLPISAFALSVAAAELPEMSRRADSGAEVAARLRLGFERISLFLVLSVVLYLTVGHDLIETLYQNGATGPDDVTLVWAVLAAYAVGIPASGASRLLQNARYAAGDVAGPARIAAARVAVAAVVGVIVMFQLDRYGIVDGDLRRLGEVPAFGPLSGDERRADDAVRLGAVGLAVGASVAAWFELAVLRRRVRGGVGRPPGVWPSLARLVGPATAAAAVSLAVVWATASLPAPVTTVTAGAAGAITYLIGANLAGNRAAVELMSPLLKRL